MVFFVGITIEASNTFLHVNPEHIGFFRVNYDSQNWASLSSLLLQNPTVSVVMSNLSGGSLIRGWGFSANNLSILDPYFPLFIQNFSAAGRAGILDDAFSLAR